MDKYNPDQRPAPDAWLDLEEIERMTLVSAYHRDNDIEVPSMSAHATVHVVVENQIALRQETVLATEARLIDEGLDRHEALHAIGAILTEQIHDTLTSFADADGGNQDARLKNLTAEGWKNGDW